MLRRGIMYLYEYEDYIYSLKMPVDPIWARANWSSVGSKFVAGGYVRYSNSGWAQGGVVMRIKTIRQDISKPYSIEISLSNGIVGGGVLKGLSDSISNQAGSISEQQDTQKRLEYNVSSLSGNYVTIDTSQTITAPKTFAEDVTFGAAREDGSYSRLLIPSSSGPGIYDLYVSTDPVDGEAPAASGGIDEDELWTILGTYGTQQIDPSHIPVIPVEKVSGLSTALSSYATQEWVEDKGYLTSVSLSTISDLHSSWDSLLQSAPDFYSKSSVYSKSEADGRFVGIANEQTVSGKKTFSALLTASAGLSGTNADLSGYISATKLYLPFSGGTKVYDILISTQPIDGEAPSEGGGINEDELWSILGGSSTNKVIDPSHIPVIPVEKVSGLSTALSSYATQSWVTSQNYAVQTNDNNLISHSNEFNFIPAGFSNVVWFNFRAKGGTGSISHYIFGRGSAVAGEYAELLGSNFIADEGAGFVKRMHTDTSNFETGPVWDNAAGTSHLAAIGYWNTPQKVFINPCYNEVTDAWDDAVGKHNFVVGKNFLTYNTYPILRSDNIGSYALTPSNYTSTLDSHYVKKAGDTMTGPLSVEVTNGRALSIKTSNQEGYLGVYINSTYKGALGYNNTHGTFLYNAAAGYYVGLRNNGQLYHGNSGGKYWHSGNDGSGSGLDADLLDGYQASEFMRSFWTNNPGYSGSTYALESFITFSYSNNTPYTGALAHIAASGYGFYLNTAYNANTRLAFRRFGKTSDGGMGPWYNLMDEGHDIYTSGKLYIPSSSGNQVFDAYIA